MLEKVLLELERVCIAEQDFCFRFFHLIDKTSQASPDPNKVCSMFNVIVHSVFVIVI